MKINKYFEFINEAKIKYLSGFLKILDSMDSNIAKDILSLSDQEVNVNFNYLDMESGSLDDIIFYQDDKVTDDKWWYRLMDNEGVFYAPFFLSNIDSTISAGDKLQIVKELTTDTIRKKLSWYTGKNADGSIIKYFICRTEKGSETIIDSKYLKRISPGIAGQKTKVGRIVNKLLQAVGKNYSQSELENFVNEFKKTASTKGDVNYLFRVVKGEDIRHFYKESSYTKLKRGVLHGSCMRYTSCQEYLDIYVENSNISLLIRLDEEDNSLITARALVWKTTTGDFFMDRIYYTNDFEVNILIDYAKSNNWLYKGTQNSEEIGLKKDGNDYFEFITVDLEYVSFNYYPYMDTLKYLDLPNKSISNKKSSSIPALESTEGEFGVPCDTCGGVGTVDCPECDGSGESGEETNGECSFCRGNCIVDCPECQ